MIFLLENTVETKLFLTETCYVSNIWSGNSITVVSHGVDPIDSTVIPQLDQAYNKENVKVGGPLLGESSVTGIGHRWSVEWKCL